MVDYQQWHTHNFSEEEHSTFLLEVVCRTETLQGNVFSLSTLSHVVNCDSIREVLPIS